MRPPTGNRLPLVPCAETVTGRFTRNDRAVVVYQYTRFLRRQQVDLLEHELAASSGCFIGIFRLRVRPVCVRTGPTSPTMIPRREFECEMRISMFNAACSHGRSRSRTPHAADGPWLDADVDDRLLAARGHMTMNASAISVARWC